LSALVWSDSLLDEARQTREEVARSLTEHGVPGELLLTGGSSLPGVLTKGDIDLHLRVAAAEYAGAVARLSGLYPIGSPHAWSGTLAVFDVPRARATGLAVTPVGSEHDVRFRSTWRTLRRHPELLEEYNAVKTAAWGSSRYDEQKSAFFTSISGVTTLACMVETISASSGREAIDLAAQLLHDFNQEYDEPSPPPEELSARLAELTEAGQVTVLLARAADTEEAVGVAVLRLQPSLWSAGQEAYLAELYVVPARRGQGHGRGLITEAMRVAREGGADYAFLVTSEDDRLAQRLYEAAGFRRTEGEGGPLMLAYEREL
jgi:ribosomal protein S18 acetylase RimI-like enzyme